MSTRPRLSADPRKTLGKKVALLRREGVLPAVVYGHGHDSEPIQIDAKGFAELRRHAGRNALVDLKVGGGQARPVLLHAVQEHPVTRRALHADFLIVRMTEEMTVDVPVAMIGESVAIEKMGGTLLHLRDTVQVRALPADLPSSLELDISSLSSFDATLHVSDLQVPEKVVILTDGGEPLARVQAPRVEEEPVAGEAAAEEEAAEGEAADTETDSGEGDASGGDS
ncbi:MAG: 50S ribosomal protein L25 [Chloroflexota bacterium]|nr:50S ribosomal protein L25 [Chloroflexota bacterium]